jgi:hypothetical protein
MLHALALLAAAVSAVLLLVMVSLTVFAVSLGARARMGCPTRGPTRKNLQSLAADSVQARPPKARRTRGPAAGTDRRA